MDSKKRILIAGAVAGGLLLLYGRGLFRWVELKAEKARLETEVASLRTENWRLYEEARRLREDPTYAEAVARREMGFARPGETVVKFQNSKSGSQPSDSRRQTLR